MWVQLVPDKHVGDAGGEDGNDNVPGVVVRVQHHHNAIDPEIENDHEACLGVVDASVQLVFDKHDLDDDGDGEDDKHLQV